MQYNSRLPYCAQLESDTGGKVMKLSNAATKLTCVKSTAIRALAAATFAGAILIAAAPAAEAQHLAIGVQIGGPRYVAPAPVYYGNDHFYGNDRGYIENRRFEEARRHEEWLRQQEFERHQRFDRDRDRDRSFDDHGRDHDGHRR
jgi:hypothetical protein